MMLFAYILIWVLRGNEDFKAKLFRGLGKE